MHHLSFSASYVYPIQNTKIIEIRESRRKGRAFRHRHIHTAAGRPAERTQPPRAAGVHASAAHSRRSGQRQTPVLCTGPIQSLGICSPRAPARFLTGSRLFAPAARWTGKGRLMALHKNQRRVYAVSRAAERPIRTAEALAAQRGRSGARKSSRCTVRQEPASHHGTNRLIRGTVRRSTTVGNAVPFRGCPQLLAGGRLGALSSHAVRVLRFRPRRPSPLCGLTRQMRVLSSRSLRARRC